MTKLIKENNSKSERYWKLGFRILGVFFFLTAFVPLIKGYYIDDLEKVPLDNTDRTLALIGFFLVWGGGVFGIIANNLGALLTKIAPNNNNGKNVN